MGDAAGERVGEREDRLLAPPLGPLESGLLEPLGAGPPQVSFGLEEVPGPAHDAGDHDVGAEHRGGPLEIERAVGARLRQLQIAERLVRAVAAHDPQSVQVAQAARQQVGEAAADPVEGGIAGAVLEGEEGHRLGDDRAGAHAAALGRGAAEQVVAARAQDDRRGQGGGRGADQEPPPGDRGPAAVQVAQQVAGALVAGRRVALHRPGDDGRQPHGDVGPRLADRRRILVHALHHHRERVVGAEGERAGEDLVQDDAQRVDVAAVVGGFAAGLLGGHVIDGADDGAGLGHGRPRLERARDAEVGDEGVPVAVDQDVLRLEVAVHDPGLVRRLERLGDLARQRQRPFDRQRPLALQQRFEIFPLDELHRDELEVARLAEVVDAQDVLVGDAAGQQDLALEPFEDLGARRHVGADHLQGDVALQLAVVGPVDGPHAALAQDGGDLVACAQPRPGGQAQAARGLASGGASRAGVEPRRRLVRRAGGRFSRAVVGRLVHRPPRTTTEKRFHRSTEPGVR